MGVLGPGDFRSDETLERRFGEFGIPRTFWAFQESFRPGLGPMGPTVPAQDPWVPIGPYIGPYLEPYLAAGAVTVQVQLRARAAMSLLSALGRAYVFSMSVHICLQCFVFLQGPPQDCTAHIGAL